METQMILVTRIYVLIQKLNEKKSHQGLYTQCCHRYLKRLTSKTGKNAKNKDSHNTTWPCVLHKSLMKYTSGDNSNQASV